MRKQELIKACPAKAKTYYKKVGFRLYVRTAPSETRTYYVRYTKKGKSISAKVGLVERMSFNDAQKLALSHEEVNNDNCVSTVSEIIDQFIKARLLSNLSHKYKANCIRSLKCITNSFGDALIVDVTYEHWFDLLSEINETGVTLKRNNVRELGSRVIQHAQAKYPFLINYPSRMTRTFIKHQKRHYPAVITDDQLSVLMRAISTHRGLMVRAALTVLASTMLRPGEVCALQWEHIDLNACEIRLPGELVKQNAHTVSDDMRKFQTQDHVVPLSTQMITLLTEIHKVSGHRKYVFCGVSGSAGFHKKMATSSLVNAIKSKKLPFLHTPHGFRATASTLLRKMKVVDSDAIELQLSHMIKNSNGRAYDRHDYIDERREMLQKWSDYLERLTSSRDVQDARTVVDIKSARSYIVRRITY